MTDAANRSHGKNASRLVWLLAGIGVAAGAFTLALITKTLLDVQDARREVAEGRTHADTLFETLDHELDDARVAYRAVLAGKAATPAPYHDDYQWKASLNAAMVEYRHAISDPTLVESLDSLVPTISRIDRLRSDCGDWGSRSAAVEKEFHKAEKALAGALSTIKASVASAQGRARLARIVRLRQAKRAGATGAQEASRPSIRELATDSDLAMVGREIADLEVLAQRLAGESNFDHFSDLKDNLFKASIDRLERDFARHEGSSENGVRNGSEQLQDFEVALFGEGFDIDEQHQTVRPGRGGLYNLARERLALRDERWRLAEAMEFELQAFADHRQRLRERGGLLNQRLALGVEASLHAVRSQMFIVGGICGVIFVLLAATIARSINGQIRDMHAINRELDKAIVHANAASKAKSQFLATMSHEIRTPMNGVLGMTELLLQSELSEEQHRLSEVAHQSAEGLLAVINDVLDFSKVEAGRLELEQLPFNPRETIEDVTSLQAARAQAKGLELLFDTGDDVPKSVIGDADRVRQVITNLIANAIKFTEGGDVCVTTRVAKQDADSILLRIEVSDSGIGIEPKTRRKLFSPFSQADSTMSREYGGTGLGLAISKQLVELMRGEIGFESECGVGTTFWFTIQLALGTHEDPEPLDGLHGCRILIVDDNRACREILLRRLRNWGAECREVASGAEALATLVPDTGRAPEFEIAIIDMHMPDMNGLQLARFMTSRPELASIKLLLLTSFGTDGRLDEVQQWELDAQLSKPIRETALYGTLTNMLGTSASGFEKRRPRAKRSSACRPIRAHVLVAEDNVVNQEVAIGMLDSLGCRSTVVGDGIEVLEAIEESDFDLILMDVQMPRMDGYAATRAIRERNAKLPAESQCTIPIVALTANAVKGDRARCIEAGMDDYLSKPFTQHGLRDVLERWIDPERENRDDSSTQDGQPESSPIEQATASDLEGVLDQEILDSLMELSPDGSNSIVVRVFKSFRGLAPRMIEQIREALEEQDIDALKRAAHSLKSSSANVGARQLSNLFRFLEAVANEGSTKGAEPIADEIDREYARVLAAMQVVLDESASRDNSASIPS